MQRLNRMQIAKLGFKFNNFGSRVCVLIRLLPPETAAWQKVNELTKPDSKGHKYVLIGKYKLILLQSTFDDLSSSFSSKTFFILFFNSFIEE